MKKIIALVMLLVLLITAAVSLTGCGDEDACFICGGSGYYEKRDCPGC